MHDSIFFVGIFIFIFLVWAATGGPNHPISFVGPFLATPTTTKGVTTYYYPQAPFGIGSSNANLPEISATRSGGTVSQSLAGVSEQTQQLQLQIKAAAAFGTPSPYRGLVTISHNTGSLANQDPKEQYIELRTSRNATSGVDITGWRLISTATTTSLGLPQGTKVPTVGDINPTAHIILEPGDTAIVSTGDSPIGVSFEENACTGYLGHLQQFSPTLDNSCPRPVDEFNRYFSGNALRDENCYNLMNTTPQCTVPDDRKPRLSSYCFDMIDHYLNYNGCVNIHRNDVEFESGTWRIYLNQDKSIWKPSRDAIRLVDTQGRTVDLFTY
jgi:hypothetical protein